MLKLLYKKFSKLNLLYCASCPQFYCYIQHYFVTSKYSKQILIIAGFSRHSLHTCEHSASIFLCFYLIKNSCLFTKNLNVTKNLVTGKVILLF